MFRRFFVIIALLAPLALRAQYDVHFSNYEAVEGYYNPSTAGKSARLNVVGAYAMQMMGFENAPRVMYAGADMPLPIMGGKHALGAHFLNDKIGLFMHKQLGMDYAFHTKAFGGQLSGGLSLGVVSEEFDGSKAELPTTNKDDAVPTTSVTGSAFDLGAGLLYQLKGYYVGISAKHINQPTVLFGETNEMHIDGSYYFMAGGNISTKNPLISVKPSVLVQTDGVALRADLTAKVYYHNGDKMLFGGVGYSPTNSVTAMIGGTFHGVQLGYAYECYTSALGAASGSHELTLGYQTDLNIFKKGKNKHKSVRFL